MIILKIRSQIVVSAIALSLASSVSGSAHAEDISQLTGKNLENNRDLIGTVMHGRNYVIETDQLGNIKQVVDAGATGAGKDAPPGGITTAANTAANQVTGIELPENYQGQDAIDFIGDDLDKTAELHGLATEKLKEMLLTDNTVRIDSNKQIFVVDDSANENDMANNEMEPVAGVETAEGSVASGQSLPITSTPNTANAFKLHSKPGASKTIYLDFNGFVATKSAWSQGTINAPAFDLDGNPNSFSDIELGNIISIWNRVAEDYIPMDVDVTTEEPSNEALFRSSKTDQTFGTRVVITKKGTINCNCGGVAYVGVVSMVNGSAFQPAWVFQQSLANNEKFIAEAISHEAGHNLGLFHDGQKVGSTVTGYYAGHGTGSTAWAPIMGLGYYKNVTQWSSGSYPGANNKQDDFAVMASNGFSFREDDVGNTFETATMLSGTVSTTGVIETQNDIDMYRIDTLGGLIDLTVTPSAKGANLDTKIKLLKTDGALVAASAPETVLNASIKIKLPAGTYFLAVSGSAHSQSGNDFGYSGYASLGQYRITGSFAAASVAAAMPTAVVKASTLSGSSSLSINFSANSSIGKGNIIGYKWSFGDGTFSKSATPVHIYTEPGKYTATLTVINKRLLRNSKSVQITVTPQAPTLRASALQLSVISSGSKSVRVAVTVVDNNNRPVPNAIVKGNWFGSFSGSVTAKTDLNGLATQTTNTIPAGSSGMTTFNLTGIEFPGYVYKPELTAKKISTVTW